MHTMDEEDKLASARRKGFVVAEVGRLTSIACMQASWGPQDARVADLVAACTFETFMQDLRLRAGGRTRLRRLLLPQRRRRLVFREALGRALEGEPETSYMPISLGSTVARLSGWLNTNASPDGRLCRWAIEWMAPVVARSRSLRTVPWPNTGCTCARPLAGTMCPLRCWLVGGWWPMRMCSVCESSASRDGRMVSSDGTSTPPPSHVRTRNTWCIGARFASVCVCV